MTVPARLATETALAYLEGGVVRVRPTARDDVQRAVVSFLDVLATATGRETFYNSKAEQEAAELAVHEAVWKVNRGLYGAMLTLPGVTDRAVQAGVARMLDNPRPPNDPSFLGFDEESRLLATLAKRLPPQRLFKMFEAFAEKRVNNRRTRTLILRSIIGAGKRLPFWAVKYREKLRTALRHALGSGVANGVAKLTSAANPTASGHAHMRKYIDKYIAEAFGPFEATVKDTVYQSVAYILGAEREGGFTVPLLVAVKAARTDLSAGADLPLEVLEGLRSRFHKTTPHARVLEIAKAAGTMTEGQKMAGKRAAAKAGVEVEFDPTRQELVKLYVYALETNGMTPAIREAMNEQAKRYGRAFHVRDAKVGIVLDASESMIGTGQQKWRPLAIGLAMRDVLKWSATECCVCETAGGLPHASGADSGLVSPSGETSLATALLKVLRQSPDSVYVITDGYENSPAGRVDEVLRAARAMGVRTPVYQVTPVLGAEAAGVRRLSNELSPLPVSRPEAVGLGMIRAALSQNVEAGIRGLLAITHPALATREPGNPTEEYAAGDGV